MSSKKNDLIPEEFASYEEAAAFWDAHDTTDYQDSFETVEMKFDIQRRVFEVEIDEDVAKELYEIARRQGVPVSRIASEMLREKIHPSA
jgi:CopG antitoxin of type II toxin-antitoxin system